MVSVSRNVVVASATLALILVSACSPQAADETPKAGDAAGTVKADTPAAPSPREEVAITLGIGKPAPPLVLGAWVKGEPIESLKSGQVYVVEFWATWCGPCLTGMPHISKLQTDYGDKVRIVGISREDEQVVREFLTKDREEGVTWDQTITYSLAMDAENAMTNTWFRAAGRTGIPSAFLVGRDGVIEWIGHPARIDEPLAKVVDGTWDRAAAIAEYEIELREMKAAAAARSILPALTKAVKAEDWTQALTMIDEVIREYPDSAVLKLRKLSILSQSGKTEEAASFLQQLVQSNWEKGDLLATIALNIAGAQFPGTLDEAERIAKRAVELTEDKGLQQLHVLARVYAEKGQLDDAIKWEKKALELAPENKVIQRTVEKYEGQKAKAAEAEGGAAKASAP